MQTSRRQTFQQSATVAACWPPPACCRAPRWPGRPPPSTPRPWPTPSRRWAPAPRPRARTSRSPAPDIAENGAVVPVGVATTLPGVKRCCCWSRRTPARWSPRFDVTDAVEAELHHPRQDGPVLQRVRRGDDERRQGALRARRKSRSPSAAAAAEPAAQRIEGAQDMADPMRIRAQAAGDKATVRVLMSHEMETGQRKDAAGKVDPGLVHPGSHRHPQRQAGADGRVGPVGREEPVPAVHRQGRQGRRQDRGQLERQQGRHAHRRSHGQLNGADGCGILDGVPGRTEMASGSAMRPIEEETCE